MNIIIIILKNIYFNILFIDKTRLLNRFDKNAGGVKQGVNMGF